MGDERAAHLEGKPRRHVVDDMNVAGGKPANGIVDFLQRAHIDQNHHGFTMGVAFEQPRQLPYDLGDILVVRHVDRLEHVRPQDAVGSIGDTRGGRVAMADDYAQIVPRSARRAQRVPHLDEQDQLRKVIELHAEGDLGLGCDLFDDRRRARLILGKQAERTLDAPRVELPPFGEVDPTP